MPADKPPEWDAMSTKEQLLWYLERLCAQADDMCSALGIARVGDPPMVTSLIDPAASTTTHASSAPVPDVSCSTTKSQEVLKVLHDTAPASIEMAHVICSMKCSDEVATTEFGDTGHDAPTAILLKPAVDLNDITPTPPMAKPEDQKEYQVVATTPWAVDITIDVQLATPIPPMLSRYDPDNNCDDVADASLILLVAHSAKSVPSVVLVHGNARVQPIARTEHRPNGVHLVMGSKCLLLPPLQKEIKQQPWPPPIQVQIVEEGVVLFYDIPQSCFTDDFGYEWWPPDHQPGDYQTELSFAVHPDGEPFLNHVWDVSPHTRHQGLLLRPIPWPSFLEDHIAEGNEIQPTPWPSFAVSVPSEVCHSSVAHCNFSVTTSVHSLHKWTFRAHPYQFAQVLDMGLTSSSFPMESCHVGDLVGNHRRHCIQKNFSGDLKLPRESWKYLQIVQRKPCQPEQEWRLSISTELQGYDTPGADREHQTKAQPLFEFSQGTTQLKHPWPSLSCNCRAVQVLSMSVLYLSSVQLKLSPSKKAFSAFRARDVHPRFGFSQKNIQLKLAGPHFSRDCRAVQFLVIHEKLTSRLCHEQLWSTKYHVCKNQERLNLCENHVLEQATTYNIPWHEKLQGGMKTMSMSANWPLLVQREYKRSGHLVKKCNAKQIPGGSRARIHLTILLITFNCCPPFGAKMLGGNAYHLLMIQIIATLLSDLPAKSIGAELQQHVTLPGNYFALFQPKSRRPLHIIVFAQVSLFSKQAIAESLHDKTSPWPLIKFEVLVLPDNKSFVLISFLSTRKWSVLGGPSQDVAELDGMVGKVERVSHMGNPIHLFVEQQMSLPDPDDNTSMNNIQIAIMHKSWDPRSITMPTSHLQPSKVTGAMVFSKEARAVGGMVPCTLSGQEHAERRGLKILMSMLTSHEWYVVLSMLL
ncbi:uncharacterized protein LOC119322328 [Triticum dicoccoides]|uniref:uncharacterized protein LOC119322328 n=1 Tax=Triticum dicoccoides TaxID=85692 RepID=UPI0018911E03|nr:uncharacterized protein LOC119322328 [Triticum dicoccoides]XP_037451721.1 uncharacterized protein LOC119322328 [Triticum dicoccoides]XP_037451722.1 uncharacterized protein LOC119322328 [Triticum dicoccoides]XP_037451723.1 uncharacterized protein LOC119322328 [Triticum dicoccoides]XP_037451724.1 uncharacterized protein LOC119322328 [Triticum dicoccoides]